MKKAFSLSEVLITIGIIGVVSILTIPTLVDNVHQRQWVNALKYDYTIVNEGFRRMMALEGVDRFEMTSFFTAVRNCENSGCSDEEKAQLHSKYMLEIFKAFENITSTSSVQASWPTSGSIQDYGECRDHVGKGSAWYVLSDESKRPRCVGMRQEVFRLNNGSTIRMSLYPSDAGDVPDPTTPLTSMVGQLTIDVNGMDNPNVFGRDAFMFVIGQNGLLYPYYSWEYAQYFVSKGENLSSYYWKTNKDVACNTHQASVGQGCAARIKEEGWKMNY